MVAVILVNFKTIYVMAGVLIYGQTAGDMNATIKTI
jgi:hypothetical protein